MANLIGINVIAVIILVPVLGAWLRPGGDQPGD